LGKVVVCIFVPDAIMQRILGNRKSGTSARTAVRRCMERRVRNDEKILMEPGNPGVDGNT